MLRHTFIHLPQIGPVTERAIWDAGVTTWEQFLSARSLPARAQRRRADLQSRILESKAHLEQADARFFKSALPGREMWRLYADFRGRAAFLDIETTGLSPQYAYITMVGILDSQGYTAYVYDENLEDLREALERYDLIVTFNGASFDLPFIEYQFGRVFRHHAHIDLMHLLRRIGYRGGLKFIETRLGAGRPSDLDGLTGFDAVLLWRMWRRGDAGARDTLIRYNAEDVASLPVLAEIVYNRLTSELSVPCRPLSPSPRQIIDLPYEIDAVTRLKHLKMMSR